MSGPRTAAAPAGQVADREAIERAVRDYFEGWFDADADRMARALHPDLVKRSFVEDTEGQRVVGSRRTAADMIAWTAEGAGRPDGAAGRDTRITIDDVSAGIATVRATSGPYSECLLLVRATDGWRILSAVWRWADGHAPRA
jgi:hypothetical protein